MASTGEAATWRLGHRPALDGVRGLAILLVVARHVGAGQTPVMAYGAVGVTLFFVLSGYLISGLLLRELDTMSGLSLRRFYARRVVRLIPALLALLVAAPLIYWWLGDPRLATVGPSAVVALAYVMNFATALGHVPATFGHTWSLAVEEQFYLLWPPLLLLMWRRRFNLTGVIGWMLMAAVAWRLVAIVSLPADWVHFSPDTNAYALLVGCWLASLERDGRMPALGDRSAGYAALLVVALGAWPWFGSADSEWAKTLAGALGGLLVLAAATAGSGWLTSRLMRWFGRISYGWYLWHAFLLWLADDILGRAGLALVSLAVAWASWQFLERPILARRRLLADKCRRQVVAA